MNSEYNGQTVALATLGCKVNQYETASFRDGFEELGLRVVDFSRPADIYVINTCAVTAKAAAQSRQMLRRASRCDGGRKTAPRLVVTGCYAQVAAREIMACVKAPVCIVGNGHKHRLVDAALSASPRDHEMYPEDIGRAKEICRLPVRRFADRTRAFLRIQDGCNNFCSYCIVPYARGRSRSLSPADVLAQAEVFAQQGYKELVLTGIHLGAYGRDLASARGLLDLCTLLTEHLPFVRYRLSSLEPTEITPQLLQFLAAADNCMPHFHIPLQSGDNGILKKMNRRYTARDFAGIVREVISLLPGAAIGVDVLAGFPGEDEAAFHNTIQLLERLPIAYLHAFPYSKRTGTVAAGLPAQVAPQVKAERVARLRALDRKKRAAFYAGNIGITHRVLAESARNGSRFLKGFSENYIPVSFEAPPAFANRILDVKLEQIADQGVFGKVIGGSHNYDR